MKFTVQKENILKAMDIAIRAIPAKSTNPLLEYFLLSVDGMEGSITSNDMATAIVTRFSTMAEQEGSVCVHAKTLYQAIKKLGKADISFELIGTTLLVKGGKARYEFPVKEAEEYPGVPNVTESTKFSMGGLKLTEMVDKTVFATSQNHSNKTLHGINLKIVKGKLVMAALDLVRIAIRETPIEADDVNVIVPGKSMSDLARSVGEEQVDIEVSKNRIVFTFGSTTMIARLIDGTFFKIEQMMNPNNNTTVTIDRNELIGCLDRSTIACSNDKMPIVMDIGDHINVSLKSNISAFDEDIECEVTGNPMKIGLNATYMMDALKAIDDDKVVLGFTNASSPAFISNDEVGYTYVVLPVNL